MIVAILLPAHNEERAIAKVITEVRAEFPEAMLVLLDSACTDRTVSIALSNSIDTISCLKGKGNAIRQGLKYINADYYLIIDSDDSYIPSDLHLVLRLLTLGEASVVFGARKFLQKGSMSKLHIFGNRALSLLASILYQNWTTDFCTGVKGFTREARDAIVPKLSANGFAIEADLFAMSVLSSFKIREVPIRYRKRKGESKLWIYDGFRIAWFLLKKRFGGE